MKTPLKIALGLFAAALLLGLATMWYLSGKSLGFSTGRCLILEDGTCLLILNNSPIVLSDRTERENLFAGLDSGDELLILHDGIQESYPGRTGAYGVWKKADGDITDISLSVLTSLAELGWNVPLETNEEPVRYPLPHQDFDTAVAWANYGDADALWAASCNRSTAIISSIPHLPILKLASLRELEDFKSAFSSQFEMRRGYDEVPAFEDITAAMDESYFSEHTLLLVYLSAGSCSFRYDVSHVDMENNTLTVHVQRTDGLTFGDCAMAGWFVTVSVPSKLLIGVADFDAVLDGPVA